MYSSSATLLAKAAEGHFVLTPHACACPTVPNACLLSIFLSLFSLLSVGFLPSARVILVSARGRRRGCGPPMHLNPLRCSLSKRSPLRHSCSFRLRVCTPSFVSSQTIFLSVTLYLGTPCHCMGSVLVITAAFASPGHHQILVGGTLWWNAAGTASSISSSAARLPRLSARTLLICGLIS
jgi:hypothetical protein